MGRHREVPGLSEFRNDEDFGRIIADMEHCKETGEGFYLCREGVIQKALAQENTAGVVKGFLLCGVLVLTIAGAIKLFPELKNVGPKILRLFRR